MRLTRPAAIAASAAFALASATVAGWVAVRDCGLGVGLAVHACAPWAARLADRYAGDADAALGVAPLDGSAYRRLAQSADAGGDGARAARLYEIALRRTPRELAAREWRFRRAVESNRMADAAHELDGLLTLDEASAPARLEASQRYLGDAAFRDVIARALREGRPWRGLLPAVLAQTARPVEVEALLDRIAGKGASAAETAFHVALLERLGRARAARATWHASLPAELRRVDGLLFDGGFEAGAAPLPYGWQFESQGGAAAGIDPGRAFEGANTLAVMFDGRAVDFTGVWQDTALPPGRYRLSLRADVHLGGTRPLQWVVTCRPDDRRLAGIDVPSTAPGWTAMDTDFAVPPDCPAQRLRLTSIGRDLAERSVAGEARFDALRIAPVGTGER